MSFRWDGDQMALVASGTECTVEAVYVGQEPRGRPVRGHVAARGLPQSPAQFWIGGERLELASERPVIARRDKTPSGRGDDLADAADIGGDQWPRGGRRLDE